MNAQAQAVVLLLVGGAILRVSFTDMYKNYVKEGLQPFLVITGALLVAMAVMTLWYELRGGGFAEKHEHDEVDEDDAGIEARADDDDGHGHGHSPWVAWLLVLPVFALLLVTPGPLGSYAASHAGTALSLQEVSDFPPLPEGDPAKISVLDYASRAVFDKGKSFGGRSVQLSGFVVTEADGKPYLARMVLACCALDARPIKVGLTGQVPSGLKADTWLEVTGKFTTKTDKDKVNGQTIPYLEVVEVHEIPAPAQPYET